METGKVLINRTGVLRQLLHSIAPLRQRGHRSDATGKAFLVMVYIIRIS